MEANTSQSLSIVTWPIVRAPLKEELMYKLMITYAKLRDTKTGKERKGDDRRWNETRGAESRGGKMRREREREREKERKRE